MPSVLTATHRFDVIAPRLEGHWILLCAGSVWSNHSKSVRAWSDTRSSFRPM